MIQFPGRPVDFVRIPGAQALRLIFCARQKGCMVSSIICESWLILGLS